MVRRRHECFWSRLAAVAVLSSLAAAAAGGSQQSPDAADRQHQLHSIVGTRTDGAIAASSGNYAFTLGGRMCEEGGYCSAGHSRFWTGDIGPSDKLREMLDAVSYKKEIILTVLSSSDEQTVWLDPVLQLHWDLERHGYAHLVVHTSNPTTCAQLHKFRHISCIWDDTPFLKGNKENRHGVWFARWKFFARVGRMGYNIMNMDADTIFFRDPYVHLKRKPMSDIQMLCNFEGGGPLHCNGGFIYIQNILPNGPVSWVFRAVVDDQMWMMDDEFALVRQGGVQPVSCHFFDQELIYDAVKSAFIGRPVYWDYFTTCRDDKWRINNRFGVALSRQDVLNNIKTICGPSKDFHNESVVAPPEGWLPTGFKPFHELTKQLVNRLTVPNLRYGWPAELGGRLGPEGRNGTYTRAWIAMLKADCPSCPWWNDDRPIKGGKDELHVPLGPKLNGEGGKFVNELFWDKDVPTELIGLGPPWISNSMTGFRDGNWAGPGVPGIGHTTAVVHVHHWAGISSWHKTVVRKVVGRYNWSLGLMTSSTQTPYTSGYPVTKVLALHPSIDLSRTRNLSEYNSIVLGLLQVAQMTHRTALIPDVPCEAAWLHFDIRGLPCAVPVNQDHNRWSMFWSVPYGYDPKDPSHQLVGGWLRKRSLLSSFTPRELEGGPLNIAYVADTAIGLPSIQPQDRGGAPAPAATRGLLAAGRSDLRRRLMQSASGLYLSADERANFWKDKRVMYSLAWNADYECTRDVGNPGAIMAHEMAHWLTTRAARGAMLTPNKTNVAFTVSQGDMGKDVRIEPMDPVEPLGAIRSPKDNLGWSVADSQVLLPVGQVVVEMSRFANEPLVYLGHPVAMVSSQERHRRGDVRKHGNHHTHLNAGQLQPEASGRTMLGSPLQHLVVALGTRSTDIHSRDLRSYTEAELTGERGKLIGSKATAADRPGNSSIPAGTLLTVEDLNSMYNEMMHRLSKSGCRLLLDERLRNNSNILMDVFQKPFPRARLAVLHNHEIQVLFSGTGKLHAPNGDAFKIHSDQQQTTTVGR